MGWVRNSYTIIAMLDYPYPASFIASLPANPVNAACEILLNATDKLAGLADSAGNCHPPSCMVERSCILFDSYTIWKE